MSETQSYFVSHAKCPNIVVTVRAPSPAQALAKGRESKRFPRGLARNQFEVVECAREDDELAPGICRICGCTDARACAGGCAWATPDLCTACIQDALLLIVLRYFEDPTFVAELEAEVAAGPRCQRKLAGTRRATRPASAAEMPDGPPRRPAVPPSAAAAGKWASRPQRRS